MGMEIFLSSDIMTRLDFQNRKNEEVIIESLIKGVKRIWHT